MSDLTNSESSETVAEENVEENVAAAAVETPVTEVEAPAAVDVPVPVPVTKVEAPAVNVTAPVAPEAAEDGTRANPRKVREGIVVSDKMDSTLVVAVNERVSHPRYGKTVQRTKKLYVHDEKNEAKIGDRVRVQETRPLSKLKRWRLTEVVERAR